MAGNTIMTTVRHVLTQSKPAVPCKTTLNKNSRGTWPQVLGNEIRIWGEFNLSTLNESYGDVLDLPFPADQLAATPRAEYIFPGLELNEPRDARRLTKWHDDLLRPTLEFAKQHLNLHTGVKLGYELSKAGKSVAQGMPDTGRTALYDHRITLDDFPLPDLVMGLALPSTKFRARQVADHLTNHAESVWALRRLANLCHKYNTRYGYILTDQALVACCFYKIEGVTEQLTGSDEPPPMKVALMPIPWTRHGEAQLTTDLALWWLSMLALSAPKNRVLVTEADVVGIGEWEVRYDDGRGCWVRRHQYSNREQRVDPPSVPVNQIPSPGSLDAFAAAAGMHMDPLFDLDGDFDVSGLDAFLHPMGADEHINMDAANDRPAGGA